MIKVKHLMDAVEPDDGQRLWVESVGLTKDLRTWCEVHHVLPHLGPAADLTDWFEQHPDGYEHFRGQYHEALNKSPYKAALQNLAKAAGRENYTLLHTGDDVQHNAATAMHEFLSELARGRRRKGDTRRTKLENSAGGAGDEPAPLFLGRRRGTLSRRGKHVTLGRDAVQGAAASGNYFAKRQALPVRRGVPGVLASSRGLARMIHHGSRGAHAGKKAKALRPINSDQQRGRRATHTALRLSISPWSPWSPW